MAYATRETASDGGNTVNWQVDDDTGAHRLVVSGVVAITGTAASASGIAVAGDYRACYVPTPRSNGTALGRIWKTEILEPYAES